MLEFLEKKKNDRFQLTASRTTFPFRRYVYCMCIYICIYIYIYGDIFRIGGGSQRSSDSDRVIKAIRITRSVWYWQMRRDRSARKIKNSGRSRKIRGRVAATRGGEYWIRRGRFSGSFQLKGDSLDYSIPTQRNIGPLPADTRPRNEDTLTTPWPPRCKSNAGPPTNPIKAPP